jgi:protein TonB
MNLIKKLSAAAVLTFTIAACNDANNNSKVDSPMDSSSVPAGSSSQYPSSADDQTVTPLDTLVDSSHINTVDTPGKKDGTMRPKKTTVRIKEYAVNRKAKMEADAAGVYSYSEVMPSFPGGEKALEKWLENNIQYPETAQDNGTEGDVLITFAVDENGKVYTPTIISNKLGDGLEEEAVAVVYKMPKWNPGKIKGKNVKTKFTLPISFQLM